MSTTWPPFRTYWKWIQNLCILMFSIQQLLYDLKLWIRIGVRMATGDHDKRSDWMEARDKHAISVHP